MANMLAKFDYNYCNPGNQRCSAVLQRITVANMHERRQTGASRAKKITKTISKYT